MSERSSIGFPVRSWSGDDRGWPEQSLEHGDLRITGTVLDDGASWHVTTDRLGWTTIALIAVPDGCSDGPDVVEAMRLAAAECSDPVQTARILRVALGKRAAGVGLAVARIGPYGRIVELLNVSLPAVLHWDPIEGMSPFEPMCDSLDDLGLDVRTEILRLSGGAALAFATPGVLTRDADFKELRGFVRAMALDPLGGTVAEAPPTELARLLRSSWGRQPGPTAVVVLGLPCERRQVA